MLNRRDFFKTTLLSSSLLFASSLSANSNNTRIKTPLFKNRDGELEEISWKQAYDIMQDKISTSLSQSGVNGIALYTNANISIVDSYALSKLFKAGFRCNNILVDSYDNEDIYAKARGLVYGIDSSSGSKDDIINTDVLLSFNSKHINSKAKIINITSKNINNIDAYINLTIKENQYKNIIKYIINQYLSSNKYDFDYLKKHFVFANYKNNSQWEVSFKDYVESFKKYTINYLIKNTKVSSMRDIEFTNIVLKIKDMILNDKLNFVSLSSKSLNTSNNALDVNLLLQSLHLLINKHSKYANNMFNISNSKSYTASINLVGLSSNRLASNMFIKYKKQQEIANTFWNLEKDTLNPISNNTKEFLSNIKNETTKFLWVCDSKEKLNQNFTNNKDLFTVYSSSHLNNTNKNANLILPTSIDNETSNLYGNEFRQIKYFAQTKIPFGNSMSLLWQTIELSKRFTIGELYKKVKVNSNLALKNVIQGFKDIGYKEEAVLYNILFYNSKLKLFKKTNEPNTETSGDKRNVVGSDGGVFKGYRYNIQEYLFEELRQFTLGNGHDLEHFKKYKNTSRSIVWPKIKNNEIIYRFNPKHDIYAKKSLKNDRIYSFYGRMNKKSLQFGNLEKITNTTKKSLKYRAKIFTVN